MTLRLTVDRAAWIDRVRRVATGMPGLIPVVKGNGFGFGRATLHPIAAELGTDVCVGTVFELDHIADGIRPVVLTPARAVPGDVPLGTVLTVGSVADVDALGGWHGVVMVKLRSSMRRFGADPAELDQVVRAVAAAGCAVTAFAMHLPLAGDDTARLAEIEAWLDHLDPGTPLWVSHLSPESFAGLTRRHPRRTFRCRVGSALWHGDKAGLHLGADVLAVTPVHAGDSAGYRGSVVPGDGHLVTVGAGSSHGVAALADGRSPFHFARTRLALVEAPHMHSSTCLVPAGDPLPAVGQWVDVQRPLITTTADEVYWT